MNQNNIPDDLVLRNDVCGIGRCCGYKGGGDSSDRGQGLHRNLLKFCNNYYCDNNKLTRIYGIVKILFIAILVFVVTPCI